MIGHSVKGTTGEEAVEAVGSRAHMSHQIEKVATDTSYTNTDRITFTMPSNVYINPPPLVNTSTTTISTICAGGITSDMIFDSDNIPQYIPIIGGGDLRGFGGSMLGIGALMILK